MDVTVTFIILRMFERVVSVLIGAFLVYLGYTLFLKLPELKDAQGNLKLPNEVSIYLSNIGPGAFFALFGSLVVALSFIFAPRIEIPQTVVNGSPQPVVSVSGAGEHAEADTIDHQKLRDVGRYIAHLNRLPELFDPELSMPQRQPIISDLSYMKLALMESVWEEELWGDLPDFRKWVEQGADESTLETLQIKSETVTFFSSGTVGGEE